MSENPQPEAERRLERTEARVECRFPDFLCIGAQKAGTTWLDANLRRHPRLWLPPIKELQYFNELYLSDRKPDKRKWTEKYREEKGKLRLQKYLENTPENERDASFMAGLHDIIEGPASDEWYGRIFGRAGQTQICGEISPEYAGLSEDGVRRVTKLTPYVKVIFSLRDPIERCWSQMRMMMRTKSLPDNPSFEKMAGNPQLMRKSNYVATIRTWRKFVPPERFLVIFMEDVKTQPHTVLSEVYALLSVKERPKAFRKSEMPIHVGDEKEMPAKVREILKGRLRPIYDDIVQLYPERGRAWMARHY